MEFRQALTFDDVLLVPAASAVLPTETDTKTRLTRAWWWKINCSASTAGMTRSR